jgi:hypothetical protein
MGWGGIGGGGEEKPRYQMSCAGMDDERRFVY